MRAFSLFYNVGVLLVFPAVISLVLIYIYPVLSACEFPAPSRAEEIEYSANNNERRNITAIKVAAFRLLIFADPQLEGDTSLPDPDAPTFPSLHRLWSEHALEDEALPVALVKSLGDFVSDDIPQLFSSYRKRLDLLGNDYYLAHIYRSLNWWTHPTHVTVLGDLLGSQWVTDEEFERRGQRFWNRVFRQGRRVEDDITGSAEIAEELGKDIAWTRRLINVAGNHDVGYAGDMDKHRAERFERVFGKANWVRTFRFPTSVSEMAPFPLSSTASAASPTPFAQDIVPELRLVVLNSMNLDGPVLDPSLQEATYSFINNDVIIPSRPLSVNNTDDTFTILLTHIPLHKEGGVCVDSPMMDYYPEGGMREQNHLSPSSSGNILEGIFGMSGNSGATAHGMGRPGIILTGHDHEGCDVYHYVNRSAMSANDGVESDRTVWSATRYTSAQHLSNDRTVPGIREITGRSMMGSYGGHAGMLSAWFNEADGQWHYAYKSCRFGVQHIWWGVHVLALLTTLCWTGVAVSLITEQMIAPAKGRTKGKRAKQLPKGSANGRVKVE